MSDEPLFTKNLLDSCVDDTIPPGIIVIDGQPFPLIEFEESE